VRVSVPLDAKNHAKLCAISALRSVDRSTTAAEILVAGLKDVVVIDSRKKTDLVEVKDRQGGASSVDNSGAEED